MDEGFDISKMLPGSVQTYANFIVAIVVAGVGIYGYYKKVRGDEPITAGGQTFPDANANLILDWLRRLFSHAEEQSHRLERIAKFLEEREHREELEREYQRGKNDADEDRRRSAWETDKRNKPLA